MMTLLSNKDYPFLVTDFAIYFYTFCVGIVMNS